MDSSPFPLSFDASTASLRVMGHTRQLMSTHLADISRMVDEVSQLSGQICDLKLLGAISEEEFNSHIEVIAALCSVATQKLRLAVHQGQRALVGISHHA